MVGVTIVVRRRSFGPAHRTLEPKARSGRPGFAARGSPKFRLGRVESPMRTTVVSAPPDREPTPVGAPGFRPKPRSSTGICDRNFGPRTAISAEIAVGRGRNSGCVERLGTRCMSAHAAGMGLRRMSTA